MKHLLQRNTNSVFAVDSCRNTPLHLAAKSGLEIIVKHLLKHSAPVTACNSEGKTPLQLAIDLQHNEVATAIIKKMEPGRYKILVGHCLSCNVKLIETVTIHISDSLEKEIVPRFAQSKEVYFIVWLLKIHWLEYLPRHI